MNYSNFYPPVTRRIRYLFLLSYLLTYWWSDLLEESSTPLITPYPHKTTCYELFELKTVNPNHPIG
jgi:hypothetical protein